MTVVFIISYMCRVKRIWYLSPVRAAKVQASLHICAVSPEPLLLAHTSSESRGTFRQKARSLAPLNGWPCAVKICHDGMLEDTDSLDAPRILKSGGWKRVNMKQLQGIFIILMLVATSFIFRQADKSVMQTKHQEWLDMLVSHVVTLLLLPPTSLSFTMYLYSFSRDHLNFIPWCLLIIAWSICICSEWHFVALTNYM